MSQSKAKPTPTRVDQLLGEASWLLSHAQALADYGRAEATAEWGRAAACAEEVAGFLDAEGREDEAAIQRVSAASCYEKVGQFARALTLLRAALSVQLRTEYRAGVEEIFRRCLAQTRKEARRKGKRAAATHSP